MSIDKISYHSNQAACAAEGIFGLACQEQSARICLVPVPFEATASFHLGTANAPQAILKASEQLDLYHPLNPNAWQQGIYLQNELDLIQPMNKSVYQLVCTVRQQKYQNIATLQQSINECTTELHQQITTHIASLLATQQRIVGLIGGDHSTALGNITAHLKQYPNMAILQFDAHDDLRPAYEGFKHSHASIMYNVLETLDLTKLVSVGIRDFCTQEHDYAAQQIKIGRLARFNQDDLNARLFNGTTWHQCCAQIAAELPTQVYVSCDIDGLDPIYCPATGTPVPGGLSFQQLIYLLRYLVQHHHQIIGFDLVEVGAQAYDANVAARILYELCALSSYEPIKD